MVFCNPQTGKTCEASMEGNNILTHVHYYIEGIRILVAKFMKSVNMIDVPPYIQGTYSIR